MGREDTFDEARHNLDVARARLAAVQERAARVLASLSGDPGLPPDRHPRFLEAQAARNAAQLDLAHTRVTAAAAGVVSNMKLQVGEFVTRGVPVFSVIESRDTWVEANFKEDQLAKMRVGQPARVHVDACPGSDFQGHVASFSPGSGEAFSPLPAQNATGNWVKVVQRVPVLLAIEQAPGQPPLRTGMSATVEIDTGHRRALGDLVDSARQFVGM